MSLATIIVTIVLTICAVAICYSIGYPLCGTGGMSDFVIGMISGAIAMGISSMIYSLMEHT